MSRSARQNREKWLREWYRKQAKAGAKPAAIAAAARLQVAIEAAQSMYDGTTDDARRVTLLRDALQGEGRLIKLLYALGVIQDTTLRRRSPVEEREEARRAARVALTEKLSDAAARAAEGDGS